MTQKEMIVRYINENGSISSWEAYAELGVTQLATRISELKEKGYIFSKKLETKRNRYGKKIHFDRYFIEEHGRVR